MRAIAAYKTAVSPWLAALGPGCRFYPSCSDYAAQAIATDGAWRGSLRALRRVGRCTPFQRGGLDLP
jgi:hypothetical protein